ncbi:hypothetical protein CLIM01_10473 [Colletotrichum limetticola]|uniref:Uncharacterized protein n=1 Tax=Colletotrichum limetticola TaxID=1209924 RepID=A0ABQ9PJD5_9PEZI|nr:hypothetical protein CLIM01_10473 [Colletotrichum limetticola]
MSGCAALPINRSGPQIISSNISSNYGSESDSEGLTDAMETRLSGLRNVAVTSEAARDNDFAADGKSAADDDSAADDEAALAEAAGNNANTPSISGRNVRIDPFESPGDAFKTSSPKHALEEDVCDNNIGHKKVAATLKSTAKRGRGGRSSGQRSPQTT